MKRPYFHQFSHGAESSVGLDFANIEEAQPFAKEVSDKKSAYLNFVRIVLFVIFSQVLFRVEERKERRARREVNYWP